MKNSTIKLAVLGALSLVSAQAAATGFVQIPTTGFAVGGNTSPYTLCNDTGDFGSGSGANAPIKPSPTAHNTCAVFPADELTAPDANFEGFDADPVASFSENIVANNTYTGGVNKTIGTLTEHMWQREVSTGVYECIYGVRVALNSTDYNPATNVQNFEVNDIAMGGFGNLDVYAAYASTAFIAEPVYRIGRTYTSVQHRPGDVAQPLTGLGSTPSINGLDSFPGSASAAQQKADIVTNWIDFTTDVNFHDDDGSTSAASGFVYVRSPCTATIPTVTTANAIRLRQTFQEEAGDGVTANRFIEVSVPGILPSSGGGSVTPTHTNPF